MLTLFTRTLNPNRCIFSFAVKRVTKTRVALLFAYRIVHSLHIFLIPLSFFIVFFSIFFFHSVLDSFAYLKIICFLINVRLFTTATPPKIQPNIKHRGFMLKATSLYPIIVAIVFDLSAFIVSHFSSKHAFITNEYCPYKTKTKTNSRIMHHI